MSGIGATVAKASAPAATWRCGVNITLWVLRILLALQFAMAGLAKVGGDPAMVEMFTTIGIGQWFRYAVGALELSGAIGVLVPRISGLAALGLVCLMAGATLTNLFVLNASLLLTICLLVVSTLVAWGQWYQTGSLVVGLGR